MTVGHALTTCFVVATIALLMALWSVHEVSQRPTMATPTPVWAGPWGRTVQRRLDDHDRRLTVVEFEVLLRADSPGLRPTPGGPP